MNRLDQVLNRKGQYFLLGILALSLLLRLYHINFQSLWVDELYTIIPTAPQSSLSSIIDYCKNDQPPLFFIYVHYVFKLTAYNEFVGRLASAFIGLLGVVAMYFLGNECQGKTTGLFASFLTGINYFHIYYSQELRFYSMVFLFAALSYFFFIRVIKNRRIIDASGYIIFTVCLLYTHYYGLFIFGSQGLCLFFFVFYKRDLKLLFLSSLSVAIIIISYIPWIPVVINDLGADLGWIKPPESYFVAQYFYYYTGKDAVAALIYVIFIYLFVRPLIKNSISKEERIVHFIIIIWIVLSYLIPYLRGLFLSPMLSDRFTIITLPAWILVFAIGWDTIKSQKWKYSLPAILFLGFLVNMVFFKKHYARIQKSQFREASGLVLSENKLHYPIYSSLPWHFNFYFRTSKDKVLALDKIDLKNVDNFWILQAHFEPEQMQDEVNKVNQNFKIVESHSFYYANSILMSRK